LSQQIAAAKPMPLAKRKSSTLDRGQIKYSYAIEYSTIRNITIMRSKGYGWARSILYDAMPLNGVPQGGRRLELVSWRKKHP